MTLRISENHRPLDLVRVRITTTPDDITVPAAGESLLCAATAFLLTLTCVGVYLFEPGNGETTPLQPLLLARRDVGIDSDFAGAGVLAVTDNHNAMPRSECGQAAPVQAFDGDMKARSCCSAGSR